MALTAGPDAHSEGSLSRVQMDEQGILKVQHLLQIARAPAAGMHGGTAGEVHMNFVPGGTMLESLADPSPTAPGGSHGHTAGRGGGSSTTTPVTFILFPQEIDLDAAGQAEEGDGANGGSTPPAAAWERGNGSPEL